MNTHINKVDVANFQLCKQWIVVLSFLHFFLTFTSLTTPLLIESKYLRWIQDNNTISKNGRVTFSPFMEA